MAGNSFGRIFKITTYGESHGAGIGVIIDGCPSGLLLDLDLIRRDLARRRPANPLSLPNAKKPKRFKFYLASLKAKLQAHPYIFSSPTKMLNLRTIAAGPIFIAPLMPTIAMPPNMASEIIAVEAALQPEKQPQG